MIFDDYFDRVVILTLPERKKRLDRAMRELKDKNLCENPKKFYGIHGDTVGVSAWFKYGGGAYGCMVSHMRILENFLMDYNFNKKKKKKFGDRKILVLEDDVIFCNDACDRFKQLIEGLPHDWGQLYLGGQHTQAPKYYSKDLFIGSSINRTHAYAIQGRAAQRVYKHIAYFPDYKGKNHHVDHQLEVAHRRGDWKTFCPSWWLAGQGENNSDISGRNLENKWWDYRTDTDLLNLPLVVSENNVKLKECHQNSEAAWDIQINTDLSNELKTVTSKAWDQRQLPFIRLKNITDENLQQLQLLHKGEILVQESCASKIQLYQQNYSQWKS